MKPKSRGFRPGHRKPSPQPAAPTEHRNDAGTEWIYGTHAVAAALANPRRRAQKLVVIQPARERWTERAAQRNLQIEVADEREFGRILGGNAVHQGVALRADPLPLATLEDLLDKPAGSRFALILDQVTDPHNVGAILRSAAAFGVDAVIMQDRHAPPMTGVVAKAASGAIDVVPVVKVVNISRTLGELKDSGFTAIGLAEEATAPLSDVKIRGDVALVLGAEGEGLRRLVRDTCSVLAKLPTNPQLPSLNVSNAAAIALYELRRQ